jgi:hypothetical protein
MDRRQFLIFCAAVVGSTCVPPRINDVNVEAASLLKKNNRDLTKTRRITIEEMKSLPKPTADQQRRFVKYVASADGWCEYLSLFGTSFICFLAPEPAYNTEDYRKAFGHLDYMSAQDTESATFHFRRLGPKGFQLAEDVIQRFSFLMYPYLDNTACFKYYRFLHSLRHLRDFGRLAKGAYHPERKLVLDLAFVADDLLSLGLEEEEHNRYQIQTLRERYIAIHTDLRNQEIAKIEEAVRRLQEL